MRCVGEWTLKREKRRNNAAKLGDLVYAYLFESGQSETFEVTGELFPRGSLRSKNSIQSLSFLLGFSQRAITKQTCLLAIKGMVARHQMQPVRHCRETIDMYCVRQAGKLQEIARKVLSASRSKRYRAKKKGIGQAMDAADTMPIDPFEMQEAIRFQIVYLHLLLAASSQLYVWFEGCWLPGG